MNEFQKAMQQAKKFIAFYQQIHLPLMRVTSKDRCLIFHQNEKKGSWFMMPTSIHIGRLQRGLAAPIAPHLSVCVWCRFIPSLMIH